jgi:hypothetical protein
MHCRHHCDVVSLCKEKKISKSQSTQRLDQKLLNEEESLRSGDESIFKPTSEKRTKLPPDRSTKKEPGRQNPKRRRRIPPRRSPYGAERFESPSNSDKAHEIKKLLELNILLGEENEKNKRRNKTLRTQNRNLKFGLNKRFLEGKNLYVSLHYAKEILIYTRIMDIAVKDSQRENQGIRATYPILYQTNAKKLAKQFRISYKEALYTIKLFTEMGAWRLKETKKNKLYVFELGERKKALGKYYVNTIYFNLSRNRARNFYRKEKIRLGYSKAPEVLKRPEFTKN